VRQAKGKAALPPSASGQAKHSKSKASWRLLNRAAHKGSLICHDATWVFNNQGRQPDLRPGWFTSYLYVVELCLIRAHGREGSDGHFSSSERRLRVVRLCRARLGLPIKRTSGDR